MKNTMILRLAVPLILVVMALSFALPGGSTRAYAQNNSVAGFRQTDLPLPRFVALAADKTYVRAGPGLRYPIKWIFRKQGLPVEIVQEFDTWRKIRDYEGGEGWVHQSLLTGERSVMVMNDTLVPLRNGPGADERMIARMEPMIVARLEQCAEQWCAVNADGFVGWVQRKFLWGIYEAEEIN